MKIKNWQLALALGVGAAAIAINFTSCVSIPKGAKAVRPFNKDKYLGKWYEIARLDFKFEKNLDNVTATYSLRDDGLIKVDNRGYDYVKNKWKQSVGKANLAGDLKEGRLKVSFFGPFYAGYNVIAIDKRYQYALVAGNNLDYLWILSREKTIPEEVKKDYLEKATGLGYDTSKLVWGNQDRD
ncbi:lipocalin family protein [Mucilaginibacter xinganensis]|uniref:Outer membrane lipoprotein Blc n=1 Tax=Mucilaginibacter xinganensis TaxID=1234841 RepID=A0A223P411_9SPHI|nr:lipocalin family protein [Mucilaginibacter xinganensis]ASU36551.1 lipocalin [Mucilaginibacter xinganensis]